jgi:hypothetical protein
MNTLNKVWMYETVSTKEITEEPAKEYVNEPTKHNKLFLYLKKFYVNLPVGV